ncbi:MAG: DUF2971 domain-containing protein [Candidatus Binataceae bacterium]
MEFDLDVEQPRKSAPVPVGSIEPLARRLNVPPERQLLYKIMTVETLLRSIAEAYLHFNRVDLYRDFPGADPHDGQQLPSDQQGNTTARFEKAPNFSMADYYDQSRSRSYACRLSLENSNFIWNNYASGSERGKVCIVFDFGKLRAMLNRTLQPGNAALLYRGNQCHQIFSINFGIIEYIEWDQHQANSPYLPNPVEYSYLKAKKFCEEKEFRISLSALGIGQFALNDGSTMQFPASLQMYFDFRAAIAEGTIREILYAPDCDRVFLHAELRKLCTVPEDENASGNMQRTRVGP